MTPTDPETFCDSALAMISVLLEESAPIAARRMPTNPAQAHQTLERMRQVGVEIAALAQSALVSRASLWG